MSQKENISNQNTVSQYTELNKFDNFVIPFNSKYETDGKTVKESEFYQRDKDDDDDET